MCGLFGFLYYGNNKVNADDLISRLAEEASIRGTDATGIAYNDKDLKVYKKPLNAYRMRFKLNGARAAIGHTRHATQGDKRKNYNNHPFTGRAGRDEFALAHNGVLMNDLLLRNSLKLPKTKIETDSYIAVQLIENKRKLNMSTLAYMAERVQGSFTFSVLDKSNNIYIVKGDSPMEILHFPDKQLYVYASTVEILWRALISTTLFNELKQHKYKEVKITEGDILKISSNGKLEYGKFKYEDMFDYRCDWRSYGASNYGMSEFDDTYYNDLISVAAGMGITADDIDELLAYGLTYDEIEDYIYCGEEV